MEEINELVDKLGDGEGPEDKRLRLPGEKKEYKIVGVRRIEMSEPLDFASKLDRSPSSIRKLMNYGDRRAGEFLGAIAFEAAWRDQDPDAVLSFFAEGAEVKLASPAGRAFYKGRSQVKSFVEKHLADGLHIDPTKHRVAGDRVTWTVRTSQNHSGRAEAAFREGKVESLVFEMREEPGS